MVNKAQARKAAARKERLRQQKHERQSHGKLRSISWKKEPLVVTPEMFPDDQYHFWLAHGINYILSNYEEGLWEPLFPDIYGENPTIPTEVAQVLVDKGLDNAATGNTSRPYQVAIAWAVTPRNVVYIYYREVLRRLLISDPKCDAETMAVLPGQPVVWEVFRTILK